MQSAFHVQVASSPELLKNGRADLWDSGIVPTSQSVHVPYRGKELASEQACFWQVRVRDNAGAWSDWSETSSWVMGLLQPTDWRGSWIGGPAPVSAMTPPDPWLRKRISLPVQPQTCLLHVASAGFHELYVNGEKIVSAVLSPAVSNLKHRVRYITYDLAGHLRQGENVIALWLGTSWSIFPAYSTPARPPQPLVRVQGTLQFSGHPSQQIVSDASWKTMPSPNTLVGTWAVHDYGGERYDARQELDDWASPHLDDSTWHAVSVHSLDLALSADASGGNILDRPLHAVGIEELPGGAYRIDMGVNYAGWFQMEVAGEPGTEIHFLFSERLTEASSYAQRSIYILGASGKGVFRNRFNYMAGRWITVTGLKVKPTLEQVLGWNIRTSYGRAGGFSCDQPLLNSIYKTTLWTLENLSLGNYIVDCPHRERTGYGDGEVAVRTGVNNYDWGAFLSQWAQDWRDVQAPDGDIPHSAPTEVGGGGPAWSGFCISLPWHIYQAYGDTRILQEGLPTMTRWLAFLETHAQDDLLVRWGSKWGFLGDWQWPKFREERSVWEKAGKALGDTPESLFFNNCYWVYALQTTASVAETLGQLDLAHRYRARAQQVRRKIHARFFQAADNSYVNGSEVYLAIALVADVPPPPLRDAVWKRLEHEIMVKRSGHIWAGIIGGVILVNLLLDNRRDDLLYAMVSKDDFPSWGEMLKKGLTTFSEGWGGADSQLHSSFLYIGSWFTEGLVGIRQPTRGFQSFEICPSFHLQDGPRAADAWLDTNYGRIASSWKREGQQVSLKISLPPNTKCTLRLRTCVPGTLTESGTAPAHSLAEKEVTLALGSGSYDFSFQLDKA